MNSVVRKILSMTLAVSVVLTCFTATAFAAETSVGVSYSAHVQDIGWQAAVSDGATAGTSGQDKRVEALKANLTNAPQDAHINYQVHVQDRGWMAVASDGTVAGTTGENKRIEALSMTISGVTGYTVEYRVHVQDIGWMNWVSGGNVAGTMGQSKRIEAIQIRLVANTANMVKSFSITPAITLTANGETGTIVTTIDPASEVSNITWLSDNTGVATVSNGIVTAVAAGTATITASVGEKTATCLVTVTNTNIVGKTFNGDRYEVDNTYQRATLISTEGTYQIHTIFPATDVDWVKFNLTQGQIYDIETSHLSNDMDTVLYLYSTDGVTVLLSNDDYNNLASFISFPASATGTYYAKVESFDFYFAPLYATSVGQYDISVTAENLTS